MSSWAFPSVSSPWRRSERHATLKTARPMKFRALQGWLPLFASLIAIGVAFDVLTRSRLSATTAIACDGEYSDSLQAQTPHNREIEQGPRSQFSYLVRSSAKYECPFFGPDGKLRRRRVQASELGSAFAYEQSGGDTYLLTNEHVAAWPEVTDTFHRIDGVPEGCKRVEDKLRIVRDERDDFEPGQVVAHARRRRSAARRRDPQGQPEAHGHPLPHRQERGPAPGQRRRGARLPARRHAGGLERQGRQPLRPRPGAGLGPRRLRDRRAAVRGQLGQPRARRVVQVARDGARRHLPRRLQGPRRAQRRRRHRPARRLHAQEEARPARAVGRRARPARPAPPTARASRSALAAGTLPLFDFGGLFVHAEVADDALLYQVYGRQFPLDDRRVVVIEDKPQGRRLRRARPPVGRCSPTGWREWPQTALGADERDLLMRVTDSMRLQILHTVDYRHALANPSSADERRKGRDLSRSLARDVPIARDLAVEPARDRRAPVGGPGHGQQRDRRRRRARRTRRPRRSRCRPRARRRRSDRRATSSACG